MERIKVKPISIRVHPSFYNWIEIERRKFMEKQKLNNLTNTNFTERLAMQQMRRRKCK